MLHKIKYLLSIFLFIFAGIECSSDILTKDSVSEISPQSKQQYIKQTVNGVTFKFCLLNEQGKEATVFNEGENFTFYFSIL